MMSKRGLKLQKQIEKQLQIIFCQFGTLEKSSLHYPKIFEAQLLNFW